MPEGWQPGDALPEGQTEKPCEVIYKDQVKWPMSVFNEPWPWDVLTVCVLCREANRTPFMFKEGLFKRHMYN